MPDNKSILLMFHCRENTGYAIESLESVFEAAARLSGFDSDRIFWGFKEIAPATRDNIVRASYYDCNANVRLIELCVAKKINLVLAFDLPYPAPVIGQLKKAGVESIVSYWGASMSAVNRGAKLLAKQLEWYLRISKPDFFIFESKAMRRTATHGRGVPSRKTAIVQLGVDTERYRPRKRTNYAHTAFGIPQDREIVFYSGHMEERKGVRILMQAAVEAVDKQGYDQVHFVLCGDKNNEADRYLRMLDRKKAKDHVLFAGYRDDISELLSSASIGVIASTGWDSFTMSSVEMMASGLPLIVSDLQGLTETIEDGVNGFLFPPGDYKSLSEKIIRLLKDHDLREKMGNESRSRAEEKFSKMRQIKEISRIISRFA